MPLEMWEKRRREPRHYRLRLANGRRNRSDQADQAPIGAMNPRRIEHEEGLVPVLVCNHASPSLIPVENNLAIESFLDQEPIHGHTARAESEVDYARFNRLPSRAGKAVLR